MLGLFLIYVDIFVDVYFLMMGDVLFDSDVWKRPLHPISNSKAMLKTPPGPLAGPAFDLEMHCKPCFLQ